MAAKKAQRRSEATAARRTLREVFGLDEFRPGQEEVIQAVLRGLDTLAVMPTGAGKSLCYQIPGLRRAGTTVVVSPLISLMRDQAEKLDHTGIDAAELHSALRKAEVDIATDAILNERADFLLVTPERLTSPEFLDSIRDKRIDLVVVDEAHCVSQWGHDFRPSYLGIRDAVHALGRPPILALTATAPQHVADDILARLGMENVTVVNTGVYRPNLHYAVIAPAAESDKPAALLSLLRQDAGSGIVYCATVRHVEELRDLLERSGIAAVHYHGRLAARLRDDHQARFMRGQMPLMVATNAFGMGIDKPDIRLVVHYDLAPSLDAYYQESGRAGRDGEAARCVLVYHRADRRTPLFFMSGKYPAAADLQAVYDALLQHAGGAPLALHDLQDQVPVARTKVRVVLNLLKESGLVRETRGAHFAPIRTNVVASELDDLAAGYEGRREADRERLDCMVAYAQSGRCRWQVLLEYFGAAPLESTCGTCDNCCGGRAQRVAQGSPEAAAAAPAPAGTTPARPGHPQPSGPRLLRGLFVEVAGLGRVRIDQVGRDTLTVTTEDGRREDVPHDLVRA